MELRQIINTMINETSMNFINYNSNVPHFGCVKIEMGHFWS